MDYPATNLVSVEINTENGFSPGTPQLLLSGFPSAGMNPPSYAVSGDGQRFIQFNGSEALDPNEETENASRMVVENWFEELRRLAPPGPQ